MRTQLTIEDIKELRYQCRMGYVLPILFFIIVSVLSVSIYEFNFEKSPDNLNIQMAMAIVFIVIALSVLISYKMNWKYYFDLRYKEKIQEVKIINKKIEITDYEAGSGNKTTLPHNNRMTAFKRYDFIIDIVKYRVEKELYDSCNEGDKVIFNYALKSKYLLSINKK